MLNDWQVEFDTVSSWGCGGCFPFLPKPRLAQTRAKPGFPLVLLEDSISLKTGAVSPRPAGGGNWARRRLTWRLVLLEGVVDEREEKHDGGVGFLGVLHQVAFLEVTIPLLLHIIFGEGDVLHTAVLTALFHGLEYHRACLRWGVEVGKKHRVFRSSQQLRSPTTWPSCAIFRTKPYQDKGPEAVGWYVSNCKLLPQVKWTETLLRMLFPNIDLGRCGWQPGSDWSQTVVDRLLGGHAQGWKGFSKGIFINIKGWEGQNPLSSAPCSTLTSCVILG